MSIPHLHCHSTYSMLKGFGKVEDWYKEAERKEIPAVAFTEYGNMASAMEAYLCEQKVKTIFGLQPYVVQDIQVKSNVAPEPIVLLAENEAGYNNLLKLSRDSWTSGWNVAAQKPFVDHEMLSKYKDGVYALTGSLSGPVSVSSNAGFKIAERAFSELFEIFGDHLRVEIQLNEFGEQKRYNLLAIDLATKHRAPMVLTNDCHFPTEKDYKLCKILRKIDRMRARPLYPREMRLSKQAYLKTDKELELYWRENHAYITSRVFDSLLLNTRELGEHCSVSLQIGQHQMPVFRPDQPGFEHPLWDSSTMKSNFDLFMAIVKEGFRNKVLDVPFRKNDAQKYKDRLKYEIGIIKQAAFTDYFLIVEDILRWSKSKGIKTGVARGSCASSLASYLCNITDVDPLEFNLLFERFLNPERITSSYPDIDLDFESERRPEIKQYIIDRYGENCFCTIGTFQTLKIKGILRDLIRIFEDGFPNDDAGSLKSYDNRVVYKVCAELEKLKVDEIGPAKKESKTFDKFCKDYEYFINNYVDPLRGQIRDLSQHAAGVIITPSDVSDWIPVRTQKAKDEKDSRVVVAQWRDKHCERRGLLKLDVLGIATLNACKMAEELIKYRHGKIVDQTDIDKRIIDRNDPNVLSVFDKGETAGSFQYNSFLQSKYLRKFDVTSFEDIITTNALLRPGPMDVGAHILFAKYKRGELKPEYAHELVKPILKNTMSIGVYQEQIMMVAHVLGGLTIAETDIMREAMKKKKVDVMKPLEEKFIHGAINHGLTEEVAKEEWKKLESFAGYGFNRCVREDSKITMANGKKKSIRNLYKRFRAGQEIWLRSFDYEKGHWVENQVEEIVKTRKKHCAKLVFVRGNELWCTIFHRIGLTTGFVRAKDLTSESRVLVVPKGRSNPVPSSLDKEASYYDDVGFYPTYDIVMRGAPYNYFANGVLVHNSHSASYALFGFYCQWLKVNYPLEFWTGTLQYAYTDPKKSENIWTLREHVLRAGFEFTKPSVTATRSGFFITKSGKINWPIRAIKGVGDKAGNHIAQASAEVRPKTFQQFWKAVKAQTVNKRVMIKLIAADAFYKFGSPRKIADEYWSMRKDEMPEELDHHENDKLYWDTLRYETVGYLDKPIKIMHRKWFDARVMSFDEYDKLDHDDMALIGGKVRNYRVIPVRKKYGGQSSLHIFEVFDSDGRAQVKIVPNYHDWADVYPEEGDIVEIIGRKEDNEKYGPAIIVGRENESEIAVLKK